MKIYYNPDNNRYFFVESETISFWGQFSNELITVKFDSYYRKYLPYLEFVCEVTND